MSMLFTEDYTISTIKLVEYTASFIITLEASEMLAPYGTKMIYSGAKIIYNLLPNDCISSISEPQIFPTTLQSLNTSYTDYLELIC